MKTTIRSLVAAIGCSLLIFDAQAITYNFNDGTMQGWSNSMVSTAAAGYYDLSFGPAQQTGHDNWGGGANATWSVPGVTSNTNGTQWTPTSVGAYFLGEIPFANQAVGTTWANWPAASSGAQQTIMSQSPRFVLDGSGALTFVGCGSSYSVPLTTLSAVPAIGGTWGTASGNPDNTKGSCAVGLLRDDGTFVLYKEFTGDPWSTYTFTTTELSPYVNDGHTYTLSVVDFWSGLNSWCAIDDVNIPGLLVPAAPSSLAATTLSSTSIKLTWTDNANNETGFKIERKTGAGGTYAEIATPAANTTTYTNTGLSANTQYYYRVRANNSTANSTYSTEANATTLPTAPAAPSALTATATASTVIRLAWTDNASNETQFKIERKTGSGGTYAQIATTSANVVTYTNTGLTANTQYYYRVRANNTGGDSAYCTEANATTLPLAPAAPSALTATATSSDTIRLAWTDNANNETGFKIERKTGSGGTYAQVATTGANVTTYTNTGLTANTQYYYRVRANNTGGDSAYCTETSATTTSGSGGSITVPNFGFETPSLGYGNWQVSPAGASWSFSNIGISGNGSGYTGGNPNAPEGVQVAFLQGGERIWQTLSGFTPGVVYTVTFSAAQRAGQNQTWSIKIDGNVIANFAPGQINTYADYTCTFTASATSHEFEFRATNLNGGDNTALIDNVRITYGSGPAVPAVPSSLAATAASSSQINLTWTDNATNETGFKIERKTGSGGTYAQIATVGANVTSYNNTGLTENTTYYYRISSTNSTGDSAYCTEASATTLVAAPAAPSSLAATASGTDTIRLTWTDNANNETQFKIERKTGSGGTYAQIATVGANVTTYTNTGLTAGTTYYYKVRANNTGGDSAYCAEANATTSSGTALPSPWLQQDIGSVGLAGSGTYSSPTFTVSGGGADIWDTADAFHFVYQPWTNDVEVIARVITQQNTDSWAKAGVMVRETLTADSKNAIMVVTPGNGLSFQRRLATGGSSSLTTTGGTVPYWVRLVRSGNTLTGYVSTDGSAWTQVGTDTITMNSTVYVGLPVTAHNNSALSVCTFDNVIVRSPSGSAPAAPSALNASAVSTSQVNLSWTDNANNETGFDIERKTGSGGTYAYVGSTGANVTTAGDSGLTANTTYYYHVRAFNGSGNSAYSSETSVTTPSAPTAPAAPSGLSATANSSSQITLAWTDNANNETSFKIERKTGSGGTYAQIYETGANVTGYVDTGLSSSTQYYYRVRASNAAGDSTFASEANATTQASGTGVGLYAEYFNNANLSGTAVLARTDATVDFSWPGAPDASLPSDNFSVRWSGRVKAQYSETYTFYTMSDDGVRLWVNGVQLVNNWTGHSATENSGTIALTANQQYDIVMEFYESGGDAVARLSWSSPSTAKAVVPQSCLYMPTAPSAPSGLVATAQSGSKITLSWNDNSTSETSFKIERKIGSGGTYAQVAFVGGNVTTYADYGLTPSTQYYYRVRASNVNGDSAYTTDANATTGVSSDFQNPGVYSTVVNNKRYEWIPSRSVNFEVLADGKVKMIAPTTKQSFNGSHTCQRFIYDHTHTRLATAEANALLGSGLALPDGNYGFTLLWINATSYDDILNNAWYLHAGPDTYADNSASADYVYLSIVPVTPAAPPGGNMPEVVIPDGLQRVSWLPHFLLLPHSLNLPADKGFGTTRVLKDIPISQMLDKITQIAYMYDWLAGITNSREWFVLRAYSPQTPQDVANGFILNKNFGYMSQCDEDFGHYPDPSNHAQKAQQVYQRLYERFQNEQGVTSPNQTRLYDDYFSDMGGYSNSEYWRWTYNSANLISYMQSETTARKNNGGTSVCAYFSQGAYNYRNWFQGAYLDSYERIPEGQRIFNEIYNFEKKFMAAPDRRVAKFGWIYAEGVTSCMYKHGNEYRLHFPTGDIIRRDFIAWPFHMMLNESFWTVLLAHDMYLWNSAVSQVTDINTWGDSWFGGSPQSLWQPTGGSIENYNASNPSHPQRTNSPLGQFPEAPQLGESGAFAGAWLVSQLTTASDRISSTIEYATFSYNINGGATQNGYYNGNTPANGSLGNAKLSRYGVANYGQANIVKIYEADKPICVYTQGANGGAVIYHNVYCGMTDVNNVTITLPGGGTRTFQVVGNNLHVFYVN